MEKDEKQYFVLEKVSESLRKAPGDLRKAPFSRLAVFGACKPIAEKSKKFTEECFAQHVDGAPSTAPRSVNFFVSRKRPAGEKWCEALFP